jgi:hypothetical protein
LERELHSFAGVTMVNATYEGWYVDKDTGEREKDVSWKYFVALSRPEVKELRAMLKTACEVFAQKCIYLSVAGHVEFVSRESHESN